MNQRQRAKFEERFEPEYEHETDDVLIDTLRKGYSAACQDESEAVRGLVEALENIEEETRPSGSMADRPVNELARAALKTWKGE